MRTVEERWREKERGRVVDEESDSGDDSEPDVNLLLITRKFPLVTWTLIGLPLRTNTT